jgi:hypothetical protein
LLITGFADEAAPDIAGQISAHKELGWKTMEIRAVDGVNAALLDGAAWEKTAAALEKAGMASLASARPSPTGAGPSAAISRSISMNSRAQSLA